MSLVGNTIWVPSEMALITTYERGMYSLPDFLGANHVDFIRKRVSQSERPLPCLAMLSAVPRRLNRYNSLILNSTKKSKQVLKSYVTQGFPPRIWIP